MQRPNIRTFQGIDPLEPDPNLPPPRKGGPWARRIAAVVGVVAILTAGFALLSRMGLLDSWLEQSQPLGQKQNPVPTPVEESPVPPTSPQPESPDDMLLAEIGVAPQTAPSQEGSTPREDIPDVTLPAPPPISRPVPPTPSPRPADRSPARRRPSSTSAPSRPAEGSRVPQAEPLPATARPEPTPPKIILPPLSRPPSSQEQTAEESDEVITVEGTFIPQLTGTRARPKWQPRPLDLPTDPLRSQLSGREIVVKVRVDKYGRTSVVRISYPPRTHDFLIRRAVESVRAISFEPARDGEGRATVDEVEVAVPLR